MINAIFIFNQKGDVLVCKLCKDGVKRSVGDVFRIQVISNLDLRSSLLTLGSTTFLHIKHDDLWIVAVTRSNTDAAVIFEFLYKFKNLLLSFFHNLNEEVIKDEFQTIYDILDEVLEFGYPQSMDYNVLKSVISTNNSYSSSFNGTFSTGSSSSSHKKSQNEDVVLTNTPWRKSGIKYKKNELFINVNEKINVLISKDGTIIKSYIDGFINMRSQLSGFPQCEIGLNDSLSTNDTNRGFLDEYDVKNPKAIPNAATGSVILEDCKFHQCVELNRFDSDRIIRFVPPDGEFELMRYRNTDNLNLPFKLTVLSSKENSSLRINLKSLFSAKLNATGVVIKVPLASNVIGVEFEKSGGKSVFATQDRCIYWKFSKFQGLTEHSLNCELQVSSAAPTAGSVGLPITMDFELLMFSASGLVIRYLKVYEKANYSTVKWVKYIC